MQHPIANALERQLLHGVESNQVLKSQHIRTNNFSAVFYVYFHLPNLCVFCAARKTHTPHAHTMKHTQRHRPHTTHTHYTHSHSDATPITNMAFNSISSLKANDSQHVKVFQYLGYQFSTINCTFVTK